VHDRANHTVDEGGLDVLTRGECLQLLDTAYIGRLGLSESSLPIILPLNFAMDHESIVFCTEAGSKLQAARARDVVCLEIDDADVNNHQGWSVIVTGRLREITDPREVEAARLLPLAPWKPTASPHFVRMSMELVSGRRLTPLRPPARR
jgi:nitroimidazol reductase NimA-like FMN-containing flavoprotein (pyridoxamine 5'-phosphate oxidase superfamily)